MKQFIPNNICLECDICCRFTQQNNFFRPFFQDHEKSQAAENDLREKFFSLTSCPGEKIITVPGNKHNYICPYFSQDNNTCKIYEKRPLDCRLYPFMLMYDSKNENILLAIDPQCPYVSKNRDNPEIKDRAKHTAQYIEKNAGLISNNFCLINDFQPGLIALEQLSVLSKLIINNDLGLKKFTLNTKNIFQQYCKNEFGSFAYCFEYHYLWSDFFNYTYQIIDEHLCVFAKHNNTVFMPLPPLGRSLSSNILSECIALMKKIHNQDQYIIENILEKDIPLFEKAGLSIKEQSQEYIYKQEDLADLPGLKFKKKRLYARNFEKTYKPKIRDFQPEDTIECLKLYLEWAKHRQAKYSDEYSDYLIQDSLYFHKRIFAEYQQHGIKGLVLEVNNKIAGYTFGTTISEDTFCVLAEITDLDKKGTAQYLFREMSVRSGISRLREIPDLTQATNSIFINTMDDSGLEYLKKAKLSYHPRKIQKLYQALKLQC